MNHTTVYAIFSLKSGEIRYIGQTCSTLYNRMKAHRHRAFTQKINTPLYCWMRACISRGEDFDIAVVRENAEWNKTEIQLISMYLENGARLLNVTPGGDGTRGLTPWKGKPRSEETKRKLSFALKGKKKTKPVSEEHRKNLSVALTGRKHSAESRKKMSEAKIRLGYKTRLGQSPSKETRDKISSTLKSRFALTRVGNAQI